LLGREGSEVAVEWRDEDPIKIATIVHVTQVFNGRNTRRTGRR
jgi:hypothetical protein